MRCSAHIVADPTEVMGINTRADLALANEVLRQEKVMDLMLSGVTIIDPKTAYVDRTVEIGKDTIAPSELCASGKDEDWRTMCH